MAEGDGDGVGGLDEGDGEDEDVGDVGHYVAEDNEGEGSVNDAGEVAGWVFEFGGYVVDLLGVSEGDRGMICGGLTLSQPSKAQRPE